MSQAEQYRVVYVPVLPASGLLSGAGYHGAQKAGQVVAERTSFDKTHMAEYYDLILNAGSLGAGLTRAALEDLLPDVKNINPALLGQRMMYIADQAGLHRKWLSPLQQEGEQHAA